MIPNPTPDPDPDGYPLYAEICVLVNAVPSAGETVQLAKDETSPPFATAITNANGIATFEIPSEPLREGLGLGPPTPVLEIPSAWILMPGPGSDASRIQVIWLPWKPADAIRTYPRYEPDDVPVYIIRTAPTPEPEPPPPVPPMP